MEMGCEEKKRVEVDINFFFGSEKREEASKIGGATTDEPLSKMDTQKVYLYMCTIMWSKIFSESDEFCVTCYILWPHV